MILAKLLCISDFGVYAYNYVCTGMYVVTILIIF